ncbi:hypothetical protein TRIUR3_27729 [Triticum urartu]|uniref:Uncharacterized protein n=1 Tax=Triticum urartu TaxID=4572 RepID=M7Y8V3_TRIUA|nr:hypothetical protein TRIUR3_27729 [Triticum urartu]
MAIRHCGDVDSFFDNICLVCFHYKAKQGKRTDPSLLQENLRCDINVVVIISERQVLMKGRHHTLIPIGLHICCFGVPPVSVNGCL